MDLPINEKEFDEILKSIKFINSELYAKLWSYKIKKIRKDSK